MDIGAFEVRSPVPVSTLPNGTYGAVYPRAITATGDGAPDTFGVTAGTLPTGLNLNADGTWSGTPTAVETFSFTVTATDSNGFTGSQAYSVTVAPAAPTVSVNPVDIPYGTALANSQLSGTATWTVGGNSVSVPGTFTYTSAAGTVLGIGNGQSEAITFTPGDSTDYNSVSTTVSVNVSAATPTVSVTPVNIPYGTALSNSQLSGTATATVGGNPVSVPGTFTYTSASGRSSVCAGGQSEAVTFTPGDSTDYATVSTTVTVNVGPVPTSLGLTASNPTPVYGKSLTFTATVATPAGSSTPTSQDGTVTFYDGATVLGMRHAVGQPGDRHPDHRGIGRRFTLDHRRVQRGQLLHGQSIHPSSRTGRRAAFPRVRGGGQCRRRLHRRHGQQPGGGGDAQRYPNHDQLLLINPAPPRRRSTSFNPLPWRATARATSSSPTAPACWC